MPRIQYIDNETGNFQETHGSDSRLNVSSRSDARAFYVSRDDGQYYVLRIEDDDAAASDLVAYLRNDSTTKKVHIRDIHISAENACTIKFAYGDATAATGTVVTPVNLNKSSSNDADVTAFGNGAVGGVTASTFFSTIRIAAGETEEYDVSLILGQNDNIVVEYDTGTTGDLEIDIFFFIE